MEKRRIKKEIEKLLKHYIGTRLRENSFDPKGKVESVESTYFNDLAHYDLAINVALLWLNEEEDQKVLENEKLVTSRRARSNYPNEMEREAMILSSFAGILMASHLLNSIPLEDILKIYRYRPSTTQFCKTITTNVQSSSISLHPFAMLTAAYAAKHTTKQGIKPKVGKTASKQNFKGPSTAIRSAHQPHDCVDHTKERFYANNGPSLHLILIELYKRAQYITANEVSGTEILRSPHELDRMGKVIFYEDRNFQGRHYECSSDCADLSPYFSRCNSIRVEGGCWVVYEKPNYMGYQYVLTKGEYPDYQRWMGFNDNIRSCRTYSYSSDGSYRMKIYERPDFGGQMMEFMDDCPSVYDRFRYRDIHSCHVMDGYWIFYEHPDYRGRQYFMRPGEYKKFSDWGATCPTIGSFRRVMDF
ncbi:hypothetical protein chiPu_0006003 [Chiloscyllium punctatum]|uniref:Beta/gamma crystallin 'Greek key' domain-containing protein n=2 Tax=Chiloscyllium punctatum TaxID=137246 RepID=A0A401SB00_CHIPU|nr:hypothetical protein [Chiloscyllium punctatum]